MFKRHIIAFILGGLTLLGLPQAAFAADTLSAGDTAWMLTATALVLFMTIPGLALFYGGLVRTQKRAICAHAMFCTHSHHDFGLGYYWL